MMRLGELILKQSQKVLDNKQHALLCCTVLSIVPFISWLSVALVAFITLRKGIKSGIEVLFPAMVVHSVPLMMLVPLDGVIINTLIAYVPCFLAAVNLRQSANWQRVSGTLFMQALIGFLLIQLFAPHFAVEQFSQFKTLLSHFEEYQQFIESSLQGIDSSALAQLFFGIQILSVFISALISLLVARFIQAKLFVPGGLKVELSKFRAGKLAFLVLIVISLFCYAEYAVAINLLPLILSYFLIAGFNLIYFAFARKWHLKMSVLLLLLIIVKPTLVLFVYIIFGLLDSLFNFRLYLPERARESI